MAIPATAQGITIQFLMAVPKLGIRKSLSSGWSTSADPYAMPTWLPSLRSRVRALVAWVHSGMSGLVSSISFEDTFRTPGRALSADELTETLRVFAIGLPDFAFAPVVRRLLWLTPPLDDYPQVRRWSQALLSYPTVAEWLPDAEALPPIMPA